MPPSPARLVTAGRVGRPHGLHGAFVLRDDADLLGTGSEVSIGDRGYRVQRRWGGPKRPLVQLEGIDGREGAARLSGEVILIANRLGPDEWLAADLIGCRVEGLGEVTGVIGGRSCDVLELEDGSLIPLIADAILDVDADRGVIEVQRSFLGL